MFKDGRVVGGVVAVAALGAVVWGTSALWTASEPAESPTVVVALDAGSHSSYDRTAAVEFAMADRQAREAEAARIAAEEAATAEAARMAAEQAAADEAALLAAEEAAAEEWVNEPSEPEPSGGIPAVWVDLGNGTGMWDFSHCPTGSGSTGADGNVYCN